MIAKTRQDWTFWHSVRQDVFRQDGPHRKVVAGSKVVLLEDRKVFSGFEFALVQLPDRLLLLAHA